MSSTSPPRWVCSKYRFRAATATALGCARLTGALTSEMMVGVFFCMRRIARMVVRLEVDGDDFESGNEIFPSKKTRGDAEYRYCGWNGGLGRWSS